MDKMFSSETGRRAILLLSWFSIVVSLALGSVLFGFSIQDSSSAAFGFAVTALLNACTSFVVVWRYTGSQNSEFLQKELKALIALGILFVLSSVFTGIKTSYSLAMEMKPEYTDQTGRNMLLTSAAAALLLGVIAFSQLILAIKMDSRILLTDAINSFCGSLVALSIVPSYKLQEYFPQLWYLDDIIGLITSCFLCIYGTMMLVKYIPLRVRGNGYELSE